MESADLESIVPDTPRPFVSESSEGAVNIVTAELLNYTYLQTGIYPQEILDREFISLYERVIEQGDNWRKWAFYDQVFTEVRKIEEAYRDAQFKVYKTHLIAEQLLNIEESRIQDIYEQMVNEKRKPSRQLDGEIVNTDYSSLVPWVNKQSLEWFIVHRGRLVLLINEVLTNSSLDNDAKDLVIKQLVEKYHKEKYSSINNNPAAPIDPQGETSKPNITGKETAGITATPSAEDVPFNPVDIAEQKSLLEASGYRMLRRGSYQVDLSEFIGHYSLDEARQLIQLLGNEPLFPSAAKITLPNNKTRRSLVFAEVVPDIYRDLILCLGYRLPDIPVEKGSVFVNTLRGQRTRTFLDVLEEINSVPKDVEKLLKSKKTNRQSVTTPKKSRQRKTGNGNSTPPKKPSYSEFDARLRRERKQRDEFWGAIEVEEDGPKPDASGVPGDTTNAPENALITTFPTGLQSPVVHMGTSVDGHPIEERKEDFTNVSVGEIRKRIHATTTKLSDAVLANGGKIKSVNAHKYRQEVRFQVLMFIQAVKDQEKTGNLKPGEVDELFTQLEKDMVSTYQIQSPKMLKTSSGDVLPNIKEMGSLAEVILSNSEFGGYQFSPTYNHASVDTRVFAKLHREGDYPDIFFYLIPNNTVSAQSSSPKYSIGEVRRFLDCTKFSNKDVRYALETILSGVQGKDRKGRLFVIESQDDKR